VAKKIFLRQVPGNDRYLRPAVTPGPGGDRSTADILSEIRRLYFKTTAKTIERDFDRAIDLLKSIPLPEDRQRATVFMEGLAEMKKEWKGRRRS
jgi:hypothetical protein